MKRHSLVIAVATVVVANAFALAHAWLNRTGPPDAAITLGQADVSWYRDPRDSGVEVHLALQESRSVLSKDVLTRLGFDCSVDPDNKDAYRFYRNQPARRAWVAVSTTSALPRPAIVGAALNPDALRGSYPDTAHVIIVPVVIRAMANPRTPPGMTPYVPASISGTLEQFPSQIHIPKPFSTDLAPSRMFRLHLTYGRYHEPWVNGVDASSVR